MMKIELSTITEPALRVASVIYKFSPEVQSWNGEAYGFSEVLHWKTGWGEDRYLNKAALAIQQAIAVLALLDEK